MFARLVTVLVYSFWKVVFVVKRDVPEPLLVKKVLSPL